MRRATAGAFTLRPARAHALLRNLPALFVASLFATPAPATAQTMQDRARAAAEMSRAKTSDSEGLRTHFVTPGMSGQPIATVDGRTQFTPALACQKTASLLEILIQPSSSGDIGTVRIARDKDLDGRFDSNFNVPLPVSGICANGLISCAPGTWNQCKSLAWGLDAASDLTLRAVDMPALAGCYCINNSCGSNLVLGNLPSVLADLGGGIVGALTTADPRIGIAEARINGPVITYVGAQTTACTDAPALGQTQYRAAPTTIQSDASAAAATSRVFQTLAASPAGAGKAEQTRSCTTAREVTVTPFDYDDIVAVRGALQSVTNCGAGCRIYRIGGTGNCNNPPATYTAVFAAPKPDRLVSARIVNIQTADWLQARVNGVAVAYAGKRPWLTNGLPSGDCGVGDNYSATPNHDFAPALKAGAVAIDARIRATGAHKSGYLDVEIHVDTTCETAERLVDLCSGYRADPACRLADEDVDDVQTVRNGVATGLRPLPQIRMFGAGACTLQLSRDFFLRTRSYKCAIDSGSPTAPDLSRGAYIIDHSTETLLADRTRGADGGLTPSSRSFSLPDRGTVAACEPICKTRAPKANNAAAPAGVVGASQNDPTGSDIFYHGCTTDNVCPAGPGEAVVSACGCLDDFPEAVAMMQTVRLAGADLVCTGGPR